jgi:hypothetical protein
MKTIVNDHSRLTNKRWSRLREATRSATWQSRSTRRSTPRPKGRVTPHGLSRCFFERLVEGRRWCRSSAWRRRRRRSATDRRARPVFVDKALDKLGGTSVGNSVPREMHAAPMDWAGQPAPPTSAPPCPLATVSCIRSLRRQERRAWRFCRHERRGDSGAANPPAASACTAWPVPPARASSPEPTPMRRSAGHEIFASGQG